MMAIRGGNIHVRARVGFALVTALCTSGCTQGELVQPTVSPPAFLANISNPVTIAGGSSQLLGTSTSVYVSLPPGTVPGGESATVENRRSGAAITTTFVEGGFDPVAIPAEVGDTIRIVARKPGGEAIAEFRVQPRRRPVVVRTDPPPGKKDVPLNATLVIVLSEPVDAASLTAVSVHLQANSDPVAGSVHLVPGAPWSVRFIPADSLEPLAMYQLVVTPELRDQDGDTLESQAVVPFTTAALPPPLPPPVPGPVAGRLAFVSTRDGGPATGILSRPFIYLANADGSGVTRFTMGESPAWSRDGRRLAFHRYSDGLVGSGTVQLVVVNADGTNERVLVQGGFLPSWSPDGRYIVYNTGVGVPNAGVYIVNVEGVPTSRLLIDYDGFAPPGGYGPGWVGNASWSPDGRSITFVLGNYGIAWSLYVINPDGSSGPRLLPTMWSLGDARPVWSPDGTRILLQVPQWLIGSVNLDGTDFRAYTNGSFVGHPDWAPDGNRVAFTRFSGPPTPELFAGTKMRIYVVDVAGGAPRQLIPDAVNPVQPEYWDTQPAWSRVRD